MRTALLVALLCSARATKPAAPFDVADEAAAAAGLECPGADVADVAARVEKLGANASTAAVERVLEAAVAASAHARAHRRVALVKTHKTASGTGQEKSDSSSLQHECSARARSGKSIRASRPFREMIARPKISRNEWKTAEI